LSKKEDGSAIDMSNVDVAFVSGGAEAKIMKDGGGVCFPKLRNFRMTLKCMRDREDMVTVNWLAKALWEPETAERARKRQLTGCSTHSKA
jgi:hypothetical protein